MLRSSGWAIPSSARGRGFKKPTIWLFADWTPWAPRRGRDLRTQPMLRSSDWAIHSSATDINAIDTEIKNTSNRPNQKTGFFYNSPPVICCQWVAIDEQIRIVELPIYTNTIYPPKSTTKSGKFPPQLIKIMSLSRFLTTRLAISASPREICNGVIWLLLLISCREIQR